MDDGEIICPNLASITEGTSSAGGPGKMAIFHVQAKINLGTASKVQGHALSLGQDQHQWTVKADQLSEDGGVVLLLHGFRHVLVRLTLEGVTVQMNGGTQQMAILIRLNCGEEEND